METKRLKTVRLYGALGDRFGRVHKLAVSTAAEAVRALCVIIPGFEAAFTEKDAGYYVSVGMEKIGDSNIDSLKNPCGRSVIRIIPAIKGAKRQGGWQIVLGIILVVVGFFTYGSTTAKGMALIAAGVAMGASGVVMMLSPQPKGNDLSDPVNNRASYMFNGPVNTVAQGNPVPYFAGRLRVGSCVISAGIYNEER